MSLLDSTLFALMVTGLLHPQDAASDHAQLAAAAREVINRTRSLDTLKIDSFCPAPGERFKGVVIFGAGPALWDSREQTRVEPARILEILEQIDGSGFYDWKAVYGGNSEGESAVRITCQVRLQIGALSFSVSQRQKGSQFAPLRELATAVIARAKSAEPGTTASSLPDGIQKIRTGELAPETLELLLHRRLADVSANRGWTLRLEGRKARLETYDGAMRNRAGTRLNKGQLRELTDHLARAGLSSLPVNLYNSQYVDLKVTVLNQVSNVQARQFAQMSAATHGEAQRRFDTLLEVLEALKISLFGDH